MTLSVTGAPTLVDNNFNTFAQFILHGNYKLYIFSFATEMKRVWRTLLKALTNEM